MRASKKLGILEVLTDRLETGAFLCRVNLQAITASGFDQTNVNLDWLNKIKNHYDRQFVDVLKIVRYDEKLSVFDGRLSVQLLLDQGINEAEAFVWDKWDKKREVLAHYVSKQFKRKMSGWNRFDMAVQAGMPVENKIMALVNKMRLTTPYDADKSIVDLPRCGILMGVYELGQETLLKQWLKVMQNWKVNGIIPDTAKSFAFGRALAKALNVQGDELVDRLKYIQPDALKQRARQRAGRYTVTVEQLRSAMVMMAFWGNAA